VAGGPPQPGPGPGGPVSAQSTCERRIKKRAAESARAASHAAAARKQADDAFAQAWKDIDALFESYRRLGRRPARLRLSACPPGHVGEGVGAPSSGRAKAMSDDLPRRLLRGGLVDSGDRPRPRRRAGWCRRCRRAARRHAEALAAAGRSPGA
jgi:hypothetical protein